jgi:3-methyl-2-oxobutanoate hydroxymethyltransferase
LKKNEKKLILLNKMKKITPLDFMDMKKRKEKITMLTAYDFPMAKALDTAGIDALLVGDSMGMVIYGHKSTLPVEVNDILRHTQAVARAAKRAMVISDMPFMSFALPEDAVRNAGKFMKYGNADAVKLEGGREREKSIKLMVECGIPVIGHIGLTPQYVNQLGGFKVQGKNSSAAEKILEDALILQEAGVFSIVLETIPWKVAEVITDKLKVPTIGIGAGPYVDGQVLVSQDMMGFFEGISFKFLKRYANVWDTMLKSSKEYLEDVKNSVYPTENHSYDIPDEEFQNFLARVKEFDLNEEEFKKMLQKIKA